MAGRARARTAGAEDPIDRLLGPYEHLVGLGPVGPHLGLDRLGPVGALAGPWLADTRVAFALFRPDECDRRGD